MPIFQNKFGVTVFTTFVCPSSTSDKNVVVKSSSIVSLNLFIKIIINNNVDKFQYILRLNIYLVFDYPPYIFSGLSKNCDVSTDKLLKQFFGSFHAKQIVAGKTRDIFFFFIALILHRRLLSFFVLRYFANHSISYKGKYRIKLLSPVHTYKVCSKTRSSFLGV